MKKLATLLTGLCFMGCTIIPASLQKAFHFQLQGEYDKAAYEYKNYAKQNPKDKLADDALALALTSTLQGKKPLTLATLDLIKKINEYREQSRLDLSQPSLKPKDINTFLQAVSYLNEGKGCKSLPYFKKVIDEYPDSEWAQWSIMGYSLKSDSCSNKKEKISELLKITQIYKGKPLAGVAHYFLGDSYYKQGNFNDALKQFTCVEKDYPKMIPVLYEDALDKLWEINEDINKN